MRLRLPPVTSVRIAKRHRKARLGVRGTFIDDAVARRADELEVVGGGTDAVADGVGEATFRQERRRWGRSRRKGVG